MNNSIVPTHNKSIRDDGNVARHDMPYTGGNELCRKQSSMDVTNEAAMLCDDTIPLHYNVQNRVDPYEDDRVSAYQILENEVGRKEKAKKYTPALQLFSNIQTESAAR